MGLGNNDDIPEDRDRSAVVPVAAASGTSVSRVSTGNNVKPQLMAGGRVQAIIPQTFEDAYRIATVIASSGLAPNGMNKPEQVMIAIMAGAEIGLPPMFSVQKIAVINGRPALWGDAVPAILWSKGFQIQETSSGEGLSRVATCRIVRPDGNEVIRSFSVKDAQEAKLWGKAGPWSQYPSRMLQMRARAFAARDGAADVLAGLYVAEELEDRDVARPTKSSAKAKRDGDYDAARQQIRLCTSLNDLALFTASDLWRDLPSAWKDLLTGEEIEPLREKWMDTIVDPQAVLDKIKADLAEATSAGDVAEIAEANAALIERLPDDFKGQAYKMLEGQ